MKTTGFGYFLRDIRENAKISLRKLAQETKLDPAYLSRLERELNPAPRLEVVKRIAKVLCDIQNLPIAECEKLKRDLLDSAGQLTDDADLIDDLKQRFAERLREQGTPESYIMDAVNKVSLEEMDGVLSGEESLEIASSGDYSDEEINKRLSLGESVHLLNMEPSEMRDMEPSEMRDSASDYIDKNSIKFKSVSRSPSSLSPRRRSRAVKKTKFRAGTRAFIEVDGDLTSNQEELLRSITNMVRSILKGK
ncbi:MAG: transcriptional regulator [Dehalococcoidia bacterium]|nr:transcriptional regulator [Dehalococcoidia bacterium]